MNIRNFICLLFFMGIFSDCKKSDTEKIPTLLTVAVTKPSQNTILSGGEILSDGGSSIIEKGVCWAKVEMPTINDSKTVDGAGTEKFVSTIPNLTPNTNYYVRAYAKNTIGTGYGNQVIFSFSADLPKIQTQETVKYIKVTSATVGGTVTSNGNSDINDLGLCYSTSPNPTINDSKIIVDPSFWQFQVELKNLVSNTTYYVRTFASNIVGTSYGNEISFKTTFGEITDIEGYIYQTIKIGNQIWMQENLKTTKYNDGSLIQLGKDYIQGVGMYWAPGNSLVNRDKFGILYNWHVVSSGKICPKGWHVPTDNEWTTLVNYLGGDNIAGGKMKEVVSDDQISYWDKPNTGATNESKFSARPSGDKGIGFSGIGGGCTFWSSTPDNVNTPWIYSRKLSFNSSTVEKYSTSKEFGHSIRCIKD